MSRSSNAELTLAADTLAALASLVRSGHSLRRALVEWPESSPFASVDDTRAIGRWIAIGGDPSDLEELNGGSSIAAVLAPAIEAAARADRRSGSFASAILDGEVAELRRRATAAADASASTSGARLSGRLVAGLPVAFLILMPGATRPKADLVGVLMLITGAALVSAGMRWLSRLTPTPPAAPVSASAARDLAALVSSGTDVTTALRIVAARTTWGALRRADRATGLGVGWIESLRWDGDEGAGALASILESGRRLGHGVVPDLRRYADEQTALSQRDFDARLRRATVLMVVPLAICVLPGFALLTVGPFLRELLA